MRVSVNMHARSYWRAASRPGLCGPGRRRQRPDQRRKVHEPCRSGPIKGATSTNDVGRGPTKSALRTNLKARCNTSP